MSAHQRRRGADDGGASRWPASPMWPPARSPETSSEPSCGPDSTPSTGNSGTTRRLGISEPTPTQCGETITSGRGRVSGVSALGKPVPGLRSRSVATSLSAAVATAHRRSLTAQSRGHRSLRTLSGLLYLRKHHCVAGVTPLLYWCHTDTCNIPVNGDRRPVRAGGDHHRRAVRRGCRCRTGTILAQRRPPHRRGCGPYWA